MSDVLEKLAAIGLGPRADRDAELRELCKRFIRENQIGCPETIYQCDWVEENALEFIENVCEIVGYCREDDEEAGI